MSPLVSEFRRPPVAAYLRHLQSATHPGCERLEFPMSTTHEDRDYRVATVHRIHTKLYINNL